ncbi:MAG: UDP-N-acetylmuramate dehydrogenase [Clostridia bacterium]|nr:UDP-N-acetylmuramate dehydrogenase [Clostridia bacterium]
MKNLNKNKKNISISNFIKLLLKKVPNINLITNKSFKDLTTFKIGGKIKYLIEIKEINILLKILQLCKEYNIKYFILGQGSNILASDKVCKILILKISLDYLKVRDNKIICGAGVNLFKINDTAIKNSLTGLEWSFGIPGTIGGAVKMNAGSFGGEIKDVVECVYYTDGVKIYKKQNSSLSFDYRKSFFTFNNFVILKVVLSLKKGKQILIKNKCFLNYENRRKTQPYNLPSAGSVFKRPQNEFAPVLIERCKLKGLRCGGAEISSKHCGFIVNFNNQAKFQQVLKLISKIKKTVLKKFDIILQEEIIILR